MDRDGLKSAVSRIASRMDSASVLERFALSAISTLLALAIGTLVVAIAGYDAGAFVSAMWNGAFGSRASIAFMLRQSTMLILAGVAVAVAFKAGEFNIGVQGQLIVGGFATTLTILFLAPILPEGIVGGILLMILGTIAAIIAGGLYGAFPGILKAYANANEVITTIMLNFIASGVVFYLIDTYLRPPSISTPVTESFPKYVALPSVILDSPSFSIIGLFVAIGAVVVIYFVMFRTRFGYEMIISGEQERAATYSGVDPKRTTVATMTLSGMVAGLTGAVFAIMILGYYINPATFPRFGFVAIAVSLLAANNPLGVIPAGLLFGAINAGGQTVGFKTAVPSELISGIVGLVVLFVATPELFRMAGRRFDFDGDDR